MLKSLNHSSVSAKVTAAILAVCMVFTCAFMSSGISASAEPSAVLSAADIYEQNVNSTVGITISGQIMSRYYGTQTFSASGSGFIISDDGYILTNYHVIEDSDKVTVATYDGKTYDAEVIGYDESNDIAVIKVDAEGLVPVTLGDSDTLRVGDDVLAIGNPLGELTFSLTKGIVSALSRNVKIESGTQMSLIQTDCAINSGNSGGALFNTSGEVIGITNAKYSSNSSGEASIDNIGFAIPINNVKKIVSSIIENGYILKPFIGVSVTSVSDDIMSITGIKAGAWVREVTEDGPAADAGLLVNDIIINVDGKDISTSADLVTLISKSDPGDELVFHVYRQGGELDITVKIGSKIQEAIKAEEPASESPAPQQNQPDDRYNYNYGTIDPYEFFRYFGFGF